MTPVVRGFVDADGRLTQADAPLLEAQRAAGAQLGDPLVLPALARLVSLARRLDQRVERPVLAACGMADIDALGRFVPDGDGVRIELADWTERAPGAAMPAEEPQGEPQLLLNWACDVRLRLVLAAPATPALRLMDGPWLARPLSQLFRLIPDASGDFPILSALAAQASFQDQSALLHTADLAIAVRLSAEPMIGDEGFTGFIGTAHGVLPVAPEAETVTVPFGADGPLSPGGPTIGMLGAVDSKRFSMRVDGAMRRPLGRIIANAETIAGQLQGPIRADYARYAADIALAGRHLLDLVDDLADLQAVERSDFTVARERVDLADLARRASGLLAMKAQERQMRIDAPGDDESALAAGEFRRVLQILLNLIGNAVRYSPEGSCIWLRVEQGDGRVSVTVADQGSGIALADQARLFEKFERLGRTDASGSGLGLYISRRLARAMGGDISIDSAPGQGARFTLTLPMWDGEPLSQG